MQQILNSSGMPQHDKTMAKEHRNDNNNQYCYITGTGYRLAIGEKQE